MDLNKHILKNQDMCVAVALYNPSTRAAEVVALLKDIEAYEETKDTFSGLKDGYQAMPIPQYFSQLANDDWEPILTVDGAIVENVEDPFKKAFNLIKKCKPHDRIAIEEVRSSFVYFETKNGSYAEIVAVFMDPDVHEKIPMTAYARKARLVVSDSFDNSLADINRSWYLE